MSGIARPVRNGADSDNATHQPVACGCGDEPSDTLHIWPPTWLIVQSSVVPKAAGPEVAYRSVAVLLPISGTNSINALSHAVQVIALKDSEIELSPPKTPESNSSDFSELRILSNQQ